MTGLVRNISGVIAVIGWQLMVPSPITAQGNASGGAGMTKVDSLFARARQLISAGRVAEGHRLADSIVSSIAPTTSGYGDALYGRASIAPASVDAERDYRQIAVEYPLAAHSGDALLRLVQLETSRGDHAAALQHLQRFWRENASSPSRATDGLTLARMLFDQNDALRACNVLADARTAAADTDVELRNQLNFLWGRCPGVLATARADSAPRAAAAADPGKTMRLPGRVDSARGRASGAGTRDSSSRTAKAKYTVQVAAYQTRAEAQQLADRLSKQGLDAFLQGSQKPFRVRVGHYSTRAEATKAAADLKKSGVTGFVTSLSN